MIDPGAEVSTSVSFLFVRLQHLGAVKTLIFLLKNTNQSHEVRCAACHTNVRFVSVYYTYVIENSSNGFHHQNRHSHCHTAEIKTKK